MRLLSVVVAASGPPEYALRTILEAGGDFEVLVVARERWEPSTSPEFAGVRWIVAPRGSDVHQLRRTGLDHASGEVVAFVEDDCLVSPGWTDAWRAAFEDPEILLATGPVERGPGASLVDWGVFFCEYAPFLSNLREAAGGPRWAGRIAGNNFAARRDWLRSVTGPDGVHEWSLRAELVNHIEAFRRVPEALVWHVGTFRLGPAIRERLVLGREFGRMRAANQPRLRGLYVLLGPAIFASQVGRLVATLVRKRRHLDRLIEAFPVTLSLLLAWSVGEWLGWLAGPASGLRSGTSGRSAGPETDRAESPPRGYKAARAAS